jgi:hypothetical protein
LITQKGLDVLRGLDQNGEHEQESFSRNLETEELELLNTFRKNIEINK